MKVLKYSMSIILAVLLMVQIPLSTFAASSKKEYVSEVVLSYGKSDDAAKNWLTKNEYRILDNNLNEGADDTFSTKRSVYLGYKTTNDPEEAITDMKLMNMNGGYNVQDYQVLLNEKKTDIQSFIDNFIIVIEEYRDNYKKGVQRAVAAHDELNMFYDDDTGMAMGDLLLNKIKEEYRDKEFEKLSKKEQKKHADMTTILLQGSSEIVLTIEQLLASAADPNDTLWIERCNHLDCYDDMLDKRMVDGTPIDQAEKKLSKEFDETATVIAALIDEYREWLKPYLESGVEITDDEDEIEDYLSNLSEEDKLAWLTEGFQCLILSKTTLSDETTLLDLFTGDYDYSGDDKLFLYPIASALSDGQRASLQFLTGYQFVAMGFNSGDEIETAVKSADMDENAKTVSVYDGIDRSMFDDDVALTGEAYKLQTSTDKDYSTNWFDDGVSTAAKAIGIISAVSIVATIGTVVAWSVAKSRASFAYEQYLTYTERTSNLIDDEIEAQVIVNNNEAMYWQERAATCTSWSRIFAGAAIGLTVVSIIMSGVTIWQTVKDLEKYYHTDYGPIPGWMVDEATNEDGELVFTYYKASTCNRNDTGTVLKNYGDINGDVGKEWVALYTTKDEAAGDPITTDFIVQYGDTNIPGTSSPLSIFCEETAQNLTNKKAGYTYADSKGGIYLFFNEDETAYAASVSTGGYIAIAAGAVVIIAAAAYLIVRSKKKKNKSAA